MKSIQALLIIGLTCFACQSQQDTVVSEEAQETRTVVDSMRQVKWDLPGVRMILLKSGYSVYTRKIGEGPIKVLLLHGGPGMTHEYMECFENYFPQAGIEFYYYDQLGSFYSDQPVDSALWTLERFVEELEQVRRALGLDSTNFYLLGNSWGGLLGMEYALKYQDNLKGLVVSNMVASIPKYAEYNAVLRDQMRPSLIDTLSAYEAIGDYHNPLYQELVFKEYYTKHVCRLDPWPEPVLRSLGHMNQTIYELMQGPSEFKVGGRLLHWDRWDDLAKIEVPTLMVGARYDTMNPEDMKTMSQLVQHGRYLHCPQGSHLAMWDDPEVYMEGVISFLQDVHQGSF